jgi:uncharacterized protein (DUF1501 family)
MKRRSFFKTAAAASIVPVSLNGMSLNAMGVESVLGNIGKRAVEGKVLVLIQLNGGNDGLNTVIPVDQYANLSKARSNVVIAETDLLKLNGYDKTTLHPKMTGLQSMFNNGKVNIVQSVGYPDPNFSHFRSTDIWMSGSDSDTIETTGWMGRYLDERFDNFPKDYPSAAMPDPLAIQIGSMVSLALMGPNTSMGMAITDPSTFYNILDNSTGSAPATPYGDELSYIRLLAQQTNKYADVIKKAANSGSNKSTKYPTSTGRSNGLAEQLKIVARLISGGLKTPVYMVSMGGFDTHAEQVDSTSHKEGTHATLLQGLSAAIDAFQDDLKLLGVSDRVVGMTFSEFGRRVQSNASGGTDHGAAAPLLVFGDAVQSGIIGNNPSIPTTTTVEDNVPMQFDFRQVYASVLKDWFELPETEVSALLGGKDYNTLPVFKNSLSSLEDFADYMTQIRMKPIFPNPANDFILVDFETDGGGELTLNVFDPLGNKVITALQRSFSVGSYQERVDLRGLRPGNYIVQLSSKVKSTTQIVQKI